LASCGAQGPGVFVRVGLATASISAVTARESGRSGIAEQPRSIAKPRRDAGRRALRHETAAMVIVSRNGRVNRFSRLHGNPHEQGTSAISPLTAPSSVYAGFIAMLKLPFKFDRS
jgi:hypothetical protein